MLKRLEIAGFKSFAKKTTLDFAHATTAIVGPNGSGKSNVAEAFRFALGEQSMKSMRGKRAEDLIWNGSTSVPRANRASVSIVFDNRKRNFKVDFDEVAIDRTVYRDGSAEYSLNGSRVRLRDIEELLAGANIGETGHHIISQGEADRILMANPRERREMLEDALGLAVYEFKKAEAEKKLGKTEENMGQVNALRRELAPHMRFLEKQVEKLEKAEQVRRELVSAAHTYFAIEDAYLAREKKENTERLQVARTTVARLTEELKAIEEGATTDAEGTKRLAEVRTWEGEAERLAGERSAFARELGRIEGGLQAAKRRSLDVAREPYAKVPREDLAALRDEVERQGKADTPEAVVAALRGIVAAVKAFMERFASPGDDLLAEEERTVYTLEREKADLAEKEQALSKSHEHARLALGRAREALTAHDEAGREIRRRILGLAEEKAQSEVSVVRHEAHERELALLADELDAAKAESVALAGTTVVAYAALSEISHEDRRKQEERKKALERLKIRLEEAGGGGEDIRHEYKEVSEREQFLARELDDLGKSAAGLRALINDLDAELAKSFAEGLAKVNAAFGEFFGILFGGGGARLVLEEAADSSEDSELEEERDLPQMPQKPGIEIAVTIPKKRLQSLMQLSGGERALTSIALIFAMSQVNPPPFLILDETDAALDEANSRRYGDMIENLSKKSQLIVITHNRETMSRASVLYGVTMGGDGISKLLSVKFDEAVAVAK